MTKKVLKMYHLTPTQEGMLFYGILNKGSRNYIEQACFDIAGEIQPNLLRDAWVQLIQRHEVLRTDFVWKQIKTPVQVILNEKPAEVYFEDLTGLTGEEQQAAIEGIKERELDSLSLEENRLNRIVFITLAPHRGLICWTCHHILIDGWSVSNLLKDFLDIYHHLITGVGVAKAPVAQFSDYLEWLKRQNKGKALEFWKRYLADLSVPTLLPGDRADLRWDVVAELKTLEGELDEAQTAKLNDFCRQQNITLNALIQTAWGILLQRYNNTLVSCSGLTTSGRTLEVKHVGEIVGVLINTIPVVVRTQPEDRVAALLERVNTELVEIRDFGYLPLPEIQGVSPLDPTQKFFDSLVVVDNHPANSIQMKSEELSLAFHASFELTNYDIAVICKNDSQFQICISYNAQIFDNAMMERIKENLLHLICAMLANPAQKVVELPILAQAERALLLQWNETARPYDDTKTIQEVFYNLVQSQPDAPALFFEGQFLTYQEMNTRANQLARTLRTRGIQPGEIVALMVDRSLELIIGAYAILKAGGAYLPLDSTYPESRIQFMLNDSGVRYLATQSEYQDKVKDFRGEILEITSPDLYDVNGDELEVVNTARDLAYVIYTSGSTGKPKGTLLEHRGILNLRNLSLDQFQIHQGDRVLQFASCTFDASVWETYMATLCGATLYLIPRDVIDNTVQLTRFINDHQINIVTLPPAYLSSLNPEEIHTLRLLITGGSAMNYDLLHRWKDKVAYINAYGPTEATIDVTTWAYSAEECNSKTVPIGRPVPNTRIYIVNSSNQLTPIGVAGELCISGDGVGRGYLNRPELTAEKFVMNPFEPGQRMYRSGDLARWLSNGTIEFLGRIDHQVKIRGFRIELGEIENQLMQYPDVRDAIVVAREDEAGETYLCAYVVSTVENLPICPDALRTHLTKELPDYMIPMYYITLPELPLNNSGKVDRSMLPAPDSSETHRVSYAPPTNETEAKLAEIWAESFKRKPIGIYDNFFTLGGHSLKAIQIAATIFKEMNTELPLRAIFEAPTIHELAQVITGGVNQIYTEIPITPEAEYYPVSSAQRRLFAVREMTGDTITYNIPIVWALEGNLDEARLTNTLQQMVQRHASLRTSFVLVNGEVRQQVEAQIHFSLERIITTEAELHQTIDAYIQPFDVSQAPLMRAAIIQTREGKNYFVMDIHHIIADGVSMDVFFREFTQIYQGQTLPELRLQYKDFAVWQNELLTSEPMQKAEAFWLNTFAGEIPVLHLPTDFPRPAVMRYEGDSYHFQLEQGVSKRFNELARKEGGTLHMALLAVFNVLLSRYSGQEDIIIGSPIAGRPHPDLEEVIGMFVNTLALRNYPAYRKTFRQFFSEVRENALKAYEYQDYQIEMLIEKLQLQRDLSRNPLFQVVFNFLKGFELAIPMEDIRFQLYPHNFHRTKFDLTFHVTETEEGLHFDLEYATKLFEHATIARMGTHLAQLIHAITENPDQALGSIPMISTEEKAALLTTFNATQVAYPKEKTITELFEAQAARTPERMAMNCNGAAMTYGELNAKANRLARTLRGRGVGPDQAVGILAERSLEMIIGVLAIIKAGGAYLPLDPDYPQSRIEYMLQDAGVSVCLADRSMQDRVSRISMCIDPADLANNCSDEEGVENLPHLNTPHDLIYIMYTSGSTGEPKGVMIEHRNVNRLISNSNMLIIREDDRILQTGSLAFDASTFEIWGALLNGAGLYLVQKGDLLSAEALERRMNLDRITMIWLTAALFNQLVEENPQIFATLRTLYVGGDVLSPKHINEVRRLYPQLSVVNGYGPTESTTFTTYFPIECEYTDAIPIGRPVSNTRVYILDSLNQLQPIGVPGELCVAGDGLARGYLNRPELTAERFVANPFEPGERIYRTGDLARWLLDGTIEFIGRKDEQVKIRGFRIELGEIENQLLRHSSIKETVVMARSDENGQKYLCAYLTADESLSVTEIRQYLSRELPEYMIPSHFVQMEQLPLTSNGKVDRKALPEPDGSMAVGGEFVAPQNEVESQLVAIWAELLGRETIGVNDSFFDLGGNSIKLITLASIIKTRLHQEIQTIDLFHHTTIRQIANYLFGQPEEENEEIIEYEL